MNESSWGSKLSKAADKSVPLYAPIGGHRARATAVLQ